MFTQILLNSIISGLLLSMVALGFNLIFNATKVFHLAHGALYVCAVYGVYGLNSILSQILPKEIAVGVSILLSLFILAIMIVLVEYLVYRPLYKKNANPTISLISSLGIYFLIVNLITFIFGNESISLNNSYSIVVSNDYFRMTESELLHLIICIILIVAILIFSKTRFYTHIRAITDSYTVAEKFGINVQKTRMIGLLAGTFLVGVAGILKGYETAIEPNMGLTIVLTASVAVIVGGVNSLRGTIIACFVIALIENFSVKIISAQWKEMLTYSLLILVLLFYQQGLISIKQRIETR